MYATFENVTFSGQQFMLTIITVVVIQRCFSVIYQTNVKISVDVADGSGSVCP